MNEMPKFDSVKTINLNENEIEDFMYHNDTSLNLILVYKNYCDAPISISRKIILDQPDEAPFTIEGQQVKGNDTIGINFNVEYDYPRGGHRMGKEKHHPNFLPKNRIQVQHYNYPLGFSINQKGVYRFRLRYTGYDECGTMDDPYCYTNWILLNIE